MHNSIVNNQDEDIEETVLLEGSQRLLRSDKLKCQLVRLELKKNKYSLSKGLQPEIFT